MGINIRKFFSSYHVQHNFDWYSKLYWSELTSIFIFTRCHEFVIVMIFSFSFIINIRQHRIIPLLLLHDRNNSTFIHTFRQSQQYYHSIVCTILYYFMIIPQRIVCNNIIVVAHRSRCDIQYHHRSCQTVHLVTVSFIRQQNHRYECCFFNDQVLLESSSTSYDINCSYIFRYKRTIEHIIRIV